MENTTQLVIFFDGSCNFCTGGTKLLRVLDWRHRLQCLPFQAPGVLQTYELAVTQGGQAIWAISSRGRIYRGAQAVSAALDAIVGLHFFLFLYRLPGIRQIEDKVYAWVAKNRRFFPGIHPYCDRSSGPCGM